MVLQLDTHDGMREFLVGWRPASLSKTVLFLLVTQTRTPVVTWIGGLDNSWNLICCMCLGRSKHV